MNRSKLKNYAPQARRDFIQAVTDRAAFYGLTEDAVEPIRVEGDFAIIRGTAFPKLVADQRGKLEEWINRDGFKQVMEAVAYTWFNRFVAIRYMELHGYLDHGYQVLSHPEGENAPEILEHAEHVTLSGLDKQKVVELKLEGTKDEELYRLLLIAQCNALNSAMPFLFEQVHGESELLLPDNLLHSDSLIRKLVTDIDEADWQEVEIIGWLYQFYISEKKDQVIGKVVKSEDIPAATQLFTPNWIVKYLVQNSIGRQWLATYPDSKLKEQMEYYIEPAEQTADVQAQLDAITPKSLNPEEMTLLDPACGSGHILVEAYDLFKAIYQERGYRAKDIPRLILRNNLFGLEIDERAAQLASFALIMKARAADRRVLEGGIWMNVRCIRSSDGLDADAVFEALTGEEPEPLPPGVEFDFMEDTNAPLLAQARRTRSATTTDVGFVVDDIRALLALFKGDDAKTFGSLIRIPDGLAKKLPEIVERTDRLVRGDDLNRQRMGERFQPIAEQATMLGCRFDGVVTNPPYIGSKGQNAKLKTFLRNAYTDVKSDTFSAFIVRDRELAKPHGNLGIMCPFVWMFISSYQKLRTIVIDTTNLSSLIQLEYSGFDGATVPICTFTLSNIHTPDFVGSFIKLSGFRGAENQSPKTLEAIRNRECGWFHTVCQDDLKRIPGSPIAFWVSDAVRNVFNGSRAVGDVAETRVGMATGDNDRFVRHWHEIAHDNIGFGLSRREAASSSKKWFPYANGGPTRKWYGNNLFVVDWSNDGRQLQTEQHHSGRIRAHNFNLDLIFRGGITWSLINSSYFGVRQLPVGFLFSSGSPSLFVDEKVVFVLMGLLNSRLVSYLLRCMNPTLNANPGDADKIPIRLSDADGRQIAALVTEAVDIARNDWDENEVSWDFSGSPLLRSEGKTEGVRETYDVWERTSIANFQRMKNLERRINTMLIDAYKLEGEFRPEISDNEITLSRTDQREATEKLVAYAIGCMMGRYSLDEPGVVYARGGSEGFDPSRHKTFPADEDGVIPITDFEWFDDDATNRFVEFIGVAWPEEHLEENLKFVAESLGAKSGEQPRDTIRRRLTNDFYKNHLSTYKRRPIYWLFSSGKEKAFQALVYLHRYNDGTLSRMRTEYVIPLQGKLSARIDHLAEEISAVSSTSHRKKLEKQRDKLRKQQAELQQFDEKLKHYAEKRITLDLDDGVKVNYGKFGDLLAEVKAVTGKKPDEE